MAKNNYIDGLSVLTFDETHLQPPVKRVSCSTQRTAGSRSDRSMESDMNSLFDGDCGLFEETKSSTALSVVPISSRHERHNSRRSLRKSHRSSKGPVDFEGQGSFDEPRSSAALVTVPDTPRHDRHRSRESSLRQSKLSNGPIDFFDEGSCGEPKSPTALVTVPNSPRHDRWNICSEDVSSSGKKQGSALDTIHTLTGTIPMFELAESNSKKTCPPPFNEQGNRRSSSFRRLIRKKTAKVHDESTLCQEKGHCLKKEHKIEREYDLMNIAIKNSARSVAGGIAGEATVSASKKVERSVKRHHEMKEVHQQASRFMESCMMKY